MIKKAELWYREGSALRGLAESFRDRYGVRALPAEAQFPADVKSTLRGCTGPIIVLIDLGGDARTFSKLGCSPHVRLIGFLPSDNGNDVGSTLSDPSASFYALLDRGVSRDHVLEYIEAALSNIKLTSDANDRGEHEREELNRLGVALSATRDVDSLLEMILAKAREITGADAGSLYVVETTGSENGFSGRAERRLRFKLTQNDTRTFPNSEYALPISEDSVAGYTALHGKGIVFDDVYRIPADRPYRFNASYDSETGYRTRSLLTVPMKNPRGDVLGVMQLLNCKRDRTARLVTPADIEREVQPFPERAVLLAESLASQAAVAYENNQLYHGVQKLFEGFVKAAATAIEQRDPTTAGHSARVTTMTLGLAEAVNRTEIGPYADVQFTAEQMKEMRYAALLHDFGKIAVREQLLVKAKKLYSPQLEIIQQRFEYLYQQWETERVQRKLDAVVVIEKGGARFEDIDEEYAEKQTELDEDLKFIIRVNEATLLPEGQFGRLIDISRKTYRDRKGINRSLLTAGEVASLSVRQGSLNDDERQEIESHVAHSFEFLTQIPWTSDLRYIPWIVRAHHEKLNGKGYPYGLRGDEIPVQAKMMIICDIFDALCSADRPYKNAVPLHVAFEILEMAVQRDELDPELCRIFMDARIFDLAREPKSQSSEDETAPTRIPN